MTDMKIYYAIDYSPYSSPTMEKVYRYGRNMKGFEGDVEMSKSFFQKEWRLVGKEAFESAPRDEAELRGEFERVFMKYNDYSRNPLSNENNIGQTIIKSKGIQHTSMSVGDIICVRDKCWMVANFGFKPVKFKVMKK